MHEYNVFLLIPPLLSTIQLYVPLHHFYLPLLCSLYFLNSLSAFGTTNMYLDITSYTGAWAFYQGSTASQGSWICLAWVAINDQDLFEISCVPPCPQTHTQFSAGFIFALIYIFEPHQLTGVSLRNSGPSCHLCLQSSHLLPHIHRRHTWFLAYLF